MSTAVAWGEVFGIHRSAITGRCSEAPRQPVTIPGAPPDSTAVLEELESNGSGKMSYDLNRIVPDSTLTMTSASTISAKERGTAQTIKMTVRMQVETKRQ